MKDNSLASTTSISIYPNNLFFLKKKAKTDAVTNKEINEVARFVPRAPTIGKIINDNR